MSTSILIGFYDIREGVYQPKTITLDFVLVRVLDQ